MRLRNNPLTRFLPGSNQWRVPNIRVLGLPRELQSDAVQHLFHAKRTSNIRVRYARSR